MLNRRELEAEMKRHGDNGGTLSEHLGISRSTFSAKLNENKSEFTTAEIMKIKTLYELDAEAIDKIFFAQKVSC